MRDKEDRRISTAGASGAATDADRFVGLCQQALGREIPTLVDELFWRLDEVLDNLADKSEDDDSDTAYLDVKRVFGEHQHEIRSLFLKHLLESEDPGATAKPQGDEVSAPGSSAAYGIESSDEAELEEMLALANLISKAENRYRNELETLRQKVAGLRGQEDIDNRSDPLSPHRLCNAFRRALKPVDHLDLAIKLVVYKLFDKQVVDQLGGVYRRCCEWATGQARTPYAGPKLVATPTPGRRSHDRS